MMKFPMLLNRYLQNNVDDGRYLSIALHPSYNRDIYIYTTNGVGSTCSLYCNLLLFYSMSFPGSLEKKTPAIETYTSESI